MRIRLCACLGLALTGLISPLSYGHAASSNGSAENPASKDMDNDPDFELSLGIGSLIDNSSASDYVDQSNTLQSTNLGRASPQYLVGASFRAPFSNFRTAPLDCLTTKKPDTRVACQYWHEHPWKGFVNVKFTSGASQAINGFVLGGSYQIAHFLDVLMGFGFTPFNEASPGLRVAASQYVTAQQLLGNDLNYDPAAMLKGSRNSFDGFPLTDSTGKLIYHGTPLEVHYRGGLVIGVALPISLKSAFSNK